MKNEVASALNIAEHEAVKIVARRHWFVLVRDVIVLALTWLAPFALYLFLNGTEVMLSHERAITLALPASLASFIASAWTLVVWIKLFGVWTDYYLDMWIITDKRVIEVEQKGFFSREIGSFRLEQIQDVTTEVRGVIATFLDFGDMHVQTAGEAREFLMRGIPHPKRVKEALLLEHDRTFSDRNA